VVELQEDGDENTPYQDKWYVNVENPAPGDFLREGTT
jgi:hypothetical protein